MTHTPTHQPASADHPNTHPSTEDSADAGASAGAGTDAHASASITTLSLDGEDPATRAARARQTNAQRAAYAAQALQLHTHVSASTTDDMQQALIELLTDLHHLCHTCDLELAPLLHTATLVYAAETQAA